MMTGKQSGSDVETKTAILVVEQEKLIEDSPRRQQEERERLIAQCHEVIGRVQAFKFAEKVMTVSGLVQIAKVKELKTYRDIPNIETWEGFCNYIGFSRQHIEDQLKNLATFGEDFLQTCQRFSLGYRDLRKLRQLTHDGTVVIDDEAVEVGGERVSLAPEHKEDLQALIERVLDEKSKALEDAQATIKAKDRHLGDKEKKIQKLHKELQRLEDTAAGKKMTVEEDAFIQRMLNLRMGFDGYLLKADPQEVMANFTEISDLMRAALISNLSYMKMRILADLDTAEMLYGKPSMLPELCAEIDAFGKKYEEWASQSTKTDA